MLTDAELLRRYAADRSETAFAELVRRHLDGVYSSALRRVGFDTNLAQDVAQAVFIALARQSRALADHPFLTAWLYTTTRNEAVTTVRRERRRKTREAVASAMNETNNSTSAESAADWSRLSPILDDTIDQLSETDRAAILLRFIAQKPFAEIGAQLRLTEDAARMRVDRALNKLRALLAKRGLTSTSTALAVVLTNHAIASAPAALASGVTAAAIATPVLSAVAILTFMSTTKTTLTLAALACFLAGGLTILQIDNNHDQQTALAEEQKRHSTLLASQQALEDEIVAREKAAAARPVTISAPPQSAASAGIPPENPRANGLAFLSRHPDVKKVLLERSRASIKFTWDPFFESAGLTPDQIEQFIQIMGEWSWYGPGALPGEKPMILPVGNTLDPNEGEKRLHAMLGEELYQKRVEFARSNPSRVFTLRIASALAFSDEPLTPDQATSLTPIIATSKAPKSASRATNFDWDAIIAKSQGLLTPTQLTALEGMRAQDEYQWESSKISKQVREASNNKSGTTGP
jgi:RNA polymerase sigma factor (sigma-70 family)